MVRAGALILSVMLAQPAAADPAVERTIDAVIMPAMARFATARQDLAQAAQSDRRADHPALRTAHGAVFDAWLAVEPCKLGPLEQDGRNLAVTFWPGPKGATPRALAALLKSDGLAALQGETYDTNPIAT